MAAPPGLAQARAAGAGRAAEAGLQRADRGLAEGAAPGLGGGAAGRGAVAPGGLSGPGPHPARLGGAPLRAARPGCPPVARPDVPDVERGLGGPGAAGRRTTPGRGPRSGDGPGMNIVIVGSDLPYPPPRATASGPSTWPCGWPVATTS